MGRISSYTNRVEMDHGSNVVFLPPSGQQVIFRTTTPTGEANLDNPPFFFGGRQRRVSLQRWWDKRSADSPGIQGRSKNYRRLPTSYSSYIAKAPCKREKW